MKIRFQNRKIECKALSVAVRGAPHRIETDAGIVEAPLGIFLRPARQAAVGESSEPGPRRDLVFIPWVSIDALEFRGEAKHGATNRRKS